MSDESSAPDVEPYRGLHEVGRGGSSVVYAAEAPDGSDVAIKVFNVGAGDPATKRRLDREAAALETLRDISGVLPVLDHRFTPDGRPCLVMPLMAGGSLADELARGPLEVDRALDIGAQVATALASAHRRDVVHRDVKPANLLVGDDGRVAIADFGIAAIGDLELASQTIASLSPPYAPPERFVDSVETASAPADVYSLAATLYALLAGVPPFGTSARGGIAGLMTRVTSEPVPAMARQDLPDGTMAVLTAAMAKDPADRYSTMDDFADALRSLRAGDMPALPGQPSDATVRRVSATPAPSLEPALVAAALGESSHRDVGGGAAPNPDDVPADPTPTRGRSSRKWALVGAAALVALALLPVAVWSMAGSGGSAETDESAQVRSVTTIRERERDRDTTSTTPTTPRPTPTVSSSSTVPSTPGGGAAAGSSAAGGAPVPPVAGQPGTEVPVGGVQLGPAQSIDNPNAAPGPGPAPSSGPAPGPAPAPAPPPAPPVTAPKVGDINLDGRVGCTDLRILLDEYGSSSARSDLNGDGTVSLVDLSKLLSALDTSDGDGTSFDDGTNRCPGA